MSSVSGMYDFIRLDVGDPDGTIFNDSLLGRILTKSVTRLNNKLGLSKTVRPIGIGGQFGGRRISVPPIVLDLSNGSISPDNDELSDLLVLQSEIIILKSEVAALRRLNVSAGGAFNQAVSSATHDDVSVTNADGVSVKVGRLATRARLYEKSLDDLNKELNDAVIRFLARESSNFGKLIF